MTTDIAVLIACALVGAVFAFPRIARCQLWRASITPLASIIGSGFLVLGPILMDKFGWAAPFVMAALCLGAWAFGAAIRFNMADGAEENANQTRAENWVDTASQWALAFAYVISVAYYLNLFGGFAVSLTPVDGDIAAHVVTTAVFALILGVGFTRGFKWLEWMEYGSVSVKLAIIAGLLVGLGFFFGDKISADALTFETPQIGGWQAIALGFGLIVTVQGFETSRYLGDSYDRKMRIRSMRIAQIVAAVIYMIYILLMAYAFKADSVPLKETAIIDLMKQVSPLLPVLLVVAALSAQFSAAVADTGGAGGLVEELTRRRLTPRKAYAVLGVLGIALTWTTDIFQIIAYASRAFAAYYALQAAIAAMRARRRHDGLLTGVFAGLAVLGTAIVIFGTPAEGG
ncbi:APC family permease [Acidimangrovimonas sediminis]|uniref:APC family permease n=1 Tax=Acidimangrovimonas sediminis TaxID=2056283 RepID=UPI000C80736D|nr:APC family permease [Acidimangrovimonas sediminis]